MNTKNDGRPAGFTTLSQDIELSILSKTRGVAMLESDWDYLKTKVANIRTPGSVFHTLGAVALSVAGSAVLVALTLPPALAIGTVPAHFVCWGVAATFGVAGALCLIFSSQQKRTLICSADDVIVEMERVERRYRVPAGSNGN